MAGAARRAKDAAMAADLKARGVKRTTGNCPICHRVVPNDGLHVTIQCKGPRRKGTRN